MPRIDEQPATGDPAFERDAPARLLNAQFVLILLSTALFGLAFSAYFLFPKFLATELDADAATIGGLSAVAMGMSVVLMPIVGVEVDRRGRRPISFFGAMLFCAASAALLTVDSVGPLVWLLRAMHGAAFSLFFISLSTLATELAPAARLGQAIGLLGGVMISTNALGPAVAEWMADEFGWRVVFASTALAAGLAGASLWLIQEQPRTHPHAASTGMLQLVARPGLRRVLGVAALAGCAMGALFTFYQPWALQLGMEQLSGYLIAFAGSAMILRFGLGGLADRIGRLRVATLSLFVYIAAPLSLIWVDALGLVLAGCILGLSHGLFFPALNAVALDFTTVRERGKAMAAYHGSFNIGFAAGSYLLGYVAAATSYPTVFAIASVICVVAFTMLLTSHRRQQRAPAL